MHPDHGDGYYGRALSPSLDGLADLNNRRPRRKGPQRTAPKVEALRG